MNGEKTIWESKSLWGSFAVIVVVVAKLAGFDIGDSAGWTESVITLVGAIVAVYGRVKAVKKISK